MYRHISICGYTFLHMYRHIFICGYTFLHMYRHIFMCGYTFLHTYRHIYICGYIFLLMYRHIFICGYIFICRYLYRHVIFICGYIFICRYWLYICKDICIAIHIYICKFLDCIHIYRHIYTYRYICKGRCIDIWIYIQKFWTLCHSRRHQNTLQHAVPYCNTLYHTATWCHSRPPTVCLAAIFKVESKALELEFDELYEYTHLCMAAWYNATPPKSTKTETQISRYKSKLNPNLNLNLYREIPRNLSFSVWYARIRIDAWMQDTCKCIYMYTHANLESKDLELALELQAP